VSNLELLPTLLDALRDLFSQARQQTTSSIDTIQVKTQKIDTLQTHKKRLMQQLIPTLNEVKV
jgi:hypothetical protein